jgi:hypothetical protein
MASATWLLEALLVLLLATTLFHAVRLERALGVLKQDKATLETLVANFNQSTRQAEAGIDRLRVATDGAGRQIAKQIDLAMRLKNDLAFLSERGEAVAERLEAAVRSGRMQADLQSMAPRPPESPAAAADPSRVRSQAERDLIAALRRRA